MKRDITSMKLTVLAAAVVLFGLCGAVDAQTTQRRALSGASSNAGSLPNQMSDLRPLNLTPEQIQKVRDIYFELKDQRQAAVKGCDWRSGL